MLRLLYMLLREQHLEVEDSQDGVPTLTTTLVTRHMCSFEVLIVATEKSNRVLKAGFVLQLLCNTLVIVQA